MATLIVGSANLKKGIEYNGFVPLGNAFRLTHPTKMSINRTPLVLIPAHEDIFALTAFTYSFEDDVVILLTRVVQDDLTIVWVHKCREVVALEDGIESDIICQVVAQEEVTVGRVTCVANIENDNSGDKDIIINAYVDDVLIGTITNSLEKKRETQTVLEFDITTPINAQAVVSFKLEAQANNMTVQGGNYPSQIQIQRLS